LSTVVDVNFDRSEMMLQVANGKQLTDQKIPSDKIAQFKFSQATVKKWFLSKTVQQIEIYQKGRSEPFVLRSDKTKLPYETAKETILQFAEKYEVPVEK